MTEPVSVAKATSPVTAAPPLETSAPDPRRWRILAVIAVTQLMLVLDASIMNIALPSAGADLRIADADVQWGVTAYTLAFGGLLLLGGRVADYLGRKRAMLIGLIGFAVASALGGAAQNAGMLFGARALQGVFGALLAPAALALITVTFTEARERAKAFGVFGAISGGGAAIGLLAGGALTEYLDWRWCLYVNLPIALVTAVVGIRVLRESRATGDRHFDIPGALLSSVGLVVLVYAFTEAAKQTTNAAGLPQAVGWTDPLVVTLLAVAAALLVGFVLLERRVANPLLPLRIVLDRNRGGSYLIFLLVGAGLFSMFLFMTFYFQYVLGYEPMKAGFAFLPFSVSLILVAGLVAQLLPRVGPKPLLVVGLTAGIVGMLLLTRTQPDSNYWTTVLPALVVLSVGMSMVFIPASSTALVGVGGHDAGIASAVLNTSQQVGGSLGLALLNTFALTATTDKFAELIASGQDAGSPAAIATANVAGYHVAYFAGAGLLALGLVAAVTLIQARRSDLPTEGAVAAA
ncbi:MFS transporter [Cellulomonas gilvus]|uniref:Drug resistance transporter, EmrB/QacA subfamily n=1 Tax=Cellulomonas gilvus (strain ATCC 13127 / NRRL B-14078) TaxID=593907 RepID=F8A3G2_CELGA|nr:MFS transporter [Cellulomonas gilvus]AEI10726.1 drug resistance transporter, EmrB/QacA subfamily [Cellulomonas gilvus ATCC 13127]